MKPKLKIVESAPVSEPVDKRLKKLLKEERRLELRLLAVRREIGPLKREYLERERCFGLSNEALLATL